MTQFGDTENKKLLVVRWLLRAYEYNVGEAPLNYIQQVIKCFCK